MHGKGVSKSFQTSLSLTLKNGWFSKLEAQGLFFPLKSSGHLLIPAFWIWVMRCSVTVTVTVTGYDFLRVQIRYKVLSLIFICVHCTPVVVDMHAVHTTLTLIYLKPQQGPWHRFGRRGKVLPYPNYCSSRTLVTVAHTHMQAHMNAPFLRADLPQNPEIWILTARQLPGAVLAVELGSDFLLDK